MIVNVYENKVVIIESIMEGCGVKLWGWYFICRVGFYCKSNICRVAV